MAAQSVRKRLKRWSLPAAITASLGLCLAVGVLAGTQAATKVPPISGDDLRSALAKRLPKTKITAVDCTKLTGLCEVSAGNTLFYTDRAARYLVIGRVYDMETRTDLTAAKLLELNPDTLLGAAAHGESARDEGQGAAVRPAAQSRVSLAELPAGGAIRWGPQSGPKVVVFSDFHCPYCARLSESLTEVGARVEERPISVLGTRALSEKVYCAGNPVAALHAAYKRIEPGTAVAGCNVSGLDANEDFAKRHGFAGTPVVVRADGAVIEGWRPAAELAAWLRG